MEFTDYILQVYLTVGGADEEKALMESTRRALVKIFSLTNPEASLTPDEKHGVKVLTGKHSGIFKVFVFIPFTDLSRVSNAAGEVWDPGFVTTKDFHVMVKNEPGLIPEINC